MASDLGAGIVLEILAVSLSAILLENGKLKTEKENLHIFIQKRKERKFSELRSDFVGELQTKPI